MFNFVNYSLAKMFYGKRTEIEVKVLEKVKSILSATTNWNFEAPFQS